MKFSPSSIIPDQLMATAPSMFIADQYGKFPDMHGDGELAINEAIRLSKLINKFVPAFTGIDNRIIRGFRIEKLSLNGKDLNITLSSGLGAIGRNAFKIPLRFDLVWKNFTLAVPSSATKGRVLLFFEYTDLVNEPVKTLGSRIFTGNPIPLPDLIQKAADGAYDGYVSAAEDTEEMIRKKVIKLIASVNPNRPMPQNAPHTPTLKYPLDQYMYSPIRVMGFFYDPETKMLLDGSNWDTESEKILITSAIIFERKNTTIDVYFDKEDREPAIVNGEKYIQQNMGYYAGTIGAIDGGLIDEETYISTEKKPNIIDVFVNMVVTRPRDPIVLDAMPTSMNNFYLFYNGVLMHPNVDYTINPDKSVQFAAASLVYGDKIYAFENISDVESGCMRNRLRKVVSESTKRIDCAGLTVESTILAFYDGLLVFPNNYEVQNGSVKFVSTITAGKKIDITECVFSPVGIFELMFAGNSTSSSSYVRVKGVRPENSYLVFYDGKYMMEYIDYNLQKDVIVFRNGHILDVNNKLVVLRV